MYMYNNEEFNYITTNLLYEKYITQFIKPLKQQNDHPEFQKYFDTNLLLNVHLSEEIHKSLQEFAIEFSQIPLFRYKYNIKRYCELYGRDDIKQTILMSVLDEIRNETSQNFGSKEETCSYINNKLETKFENLNEEIRQQIAYDVLKSAFVINSGKLKSWKYYYTTTHDPDHNDREIFDHITTDMLYAEYITQYIDQIVTNNNTNLLLEIELSDEINEALMTKAFELSKMKRFQKNIKTYSKLYGRMVNDIELEQIAFDVLKSALIVNL